MINCRSFCLLKKEYRLMNNNKGRAIALLPIGVFLLIFIGSGIITGDFYSMPAIVGFLIALIVAFMQNKKLSFVQKLHMASWPVRQAEPIMLAETCFFSC